ncbi:hypothetical protein [Caudoviricetes sp.]|nr:hypothetical protein [Caudoviricetes sp.]
MGLIPSLTSISGTISAAPHNNNYAAIRTAVNTYGAFVDQTATITGAWTFSTSPTITNSLTVGTGLTVTAGGLTVTAGASTFGAAVGITGTCTATTFSGSGASLTNLPASALTGVITVAEYNAGNSGASISLDLSLGTAQRLTLNAATPQITPTNGVAGTMYTLRLVQDAIGGRQPTYVNTGNTPTLTTTANTSSILLLYCISSTNYKVVTSCTGV